MKTEYLLNREVEQVLMLLTPSNRLALRVSLHTGLRISDVLSLEAAKLSSRMWVVESKTGKKKLIGLPTELLRDLRSHAVGRWVFPARTDPTRHRTRQAVWADLKRASKAFRLKQNVAPHSFRKCYAVDLREKYGDIEKVRRALNHDNQATTLIYAMADIALNAKHKKGRSKA